MPATLEELTHTLREFRDKDPNGNGQRDELPTSGRQEARYIDDLFAFFGVAMWGGNPAWDIYDGALTYSAVTPNMREALAFASELYREGLLDPETLLNDLAAWYGKIKSDRVGVYYHWVESVNEHLVDIQQATGARGDYTVLPALSAPGRQGFYTMQAFRTPEFLVKNQTDPAKVDACFKVLNAYGDKDLWMDFYMGVEGMHHKVVEGKKVRTPDTDKTAIENLTLCPYNALSTLDFKVELLQNLADADGETKWMYDQCVRNLKALQQYGKPIAGDGLPTKVYENYPDIQNRTLFVEYASKIIAGEYPITKFEEFVDKWYATGGAAVTEAARAWYGGL
jgi:putative aldouronate transport system substrate-binding protein